jgi:hypothetical protein
MHHVILLTFAFNLMPASNPEDRVDRLAKAIAETKDHNLMIRRELRSDYEAIVHCLTQEDFSECERVSLPLEVGIII